MLKQIAQGAPTDGFILAKGEQYAEEEDCPPEAKTAKLSAAKSGGLARLKLLKAENERNGVGEGRK